MESVLNYSKIRKLKFTIINKIIVKFETLWTILLFVFGGIIWYYSIKTPPMSDSLPDKVFNFIRKDFVYHFIAYSGLSGVYFLHKGREMIDNTKIIIEKSKED